MAVAEQELDALVARAEELADRARKRPSWDEARAALTEAGVQRGMAAQITALDILDAAKRQLRAAQTEQRGAKETYDDALTDAEWEADDHFVTEGSKTYLVDGDNRKPMLADDVRKWKTQRAKKSPAVAAARKALDAADEAVAAARDEVDLAEARLSVSKHDLVARVAILQHFTYAIPKER